MRKEFSIMREEFNVAKTELDNLRNQIRETSKRAFRDGAKTLFETYPELENFSWRQYTMYFNDGDPCYFFANTDDFFVNDDYSYDMEEDHVLYKAAGEIGEFLSVFDNDDFEFMFGDHAEITVTREAVHISEYTNHD